MNYSFLINRMQTLFKNAINYFIKKYMRYDLKFYFNDGATSHVAQAKT